MNKPLTVKQEAIFSYIKSSIRDSGFPPTVREIGDHFHITVKGAYDHLKAIEKKGYIRCTQNKSRAIELLVNRDDTKTQSLCQIPLVGRIAAGNPILAEEHIDDYLFFPQPLLGNGEFFALKVRGDSMIEKGIFDGDIAILKKQPIAHNGEIVAALVEGDATLKIFRKMGSKIHLVPANSGYQPIISDDILILGTLVSIFRRY
jgi:repressor LexA